MSKPTCKSCGEPLRGNRFRATDSPELTGMLRVRCRDCVFGIRDGSRRAFETNRIARWLRGVMR